MRTDEAILGKNWYLSIDLLSYFPNGDGFQNFCKQLFFLSRILVKW